MSDAHVDPERVLRGAVRTGDGPAVLAALAAGPYLDAPQLLGEQLKVALARGLTGLEPAIHALIDALRERDETGDAELADDLAALIGAGPTPLLRPLPVELDELTEVLEGDPTMTGGRIDLATGDVIPESSMFDSGLDEDEEDLDDPERWLYVPSEGSRDGFDDMVDFLDTVADPAERERLEDALDRRGPFRHFKDTLARYPGELARFHRFTDDRRIGRARAWLAREGFRPVARSGQ